MIARWFSDCECKSEDHRPLLGGVVCWGGFLGGGGGSTKSAAELA